MKKSVLAYPDVVAAGTAIKAHCKPASADTYAYDEGWSDKRVLDEVIGGRGTEKNIENLRLALGIRLVRSVAVDVPSRLAALEATVVKLQTEFTALADALGLPKA